MTDQTAALPQAEARPSEGEVEQRLARFVALIEPGHRANVTLALVKTYPSLDGVSYIEQLIADVRALLAENDEIRAANFRWVAKCQAMFAAKEAAESKLSVLVEEMKNRGSVVPLPAASVTSADTSNQGLRRLQGRVSKEGTTMSDTDYNAMQPGDMLAAVADDAQKWARAFCQHNPAADEGLMIGWFANAIENTWDVRCSRLARNDDAWLSLQDQVFAHRRFWAELAEAPPCDVGAITPASVGEASNEGAAFGGRPNPNSDPS